MSNQKVIQYLYRLLLIQNGAQRCRLNKVFKEYEDRILEMGENFSCMENAFDKK